jgi:4-hydroxy-tetrahydrodipicolinate synthase
MRLIPNSVVTTHGLRAAPRRTVDRFHGSIVALVTPFRGGRVDQDALVALCRRQIESGTSALVVCGSTGEGSALTEAEHAGTIAAAVAASGGAVPVVGGCGAPATEPATALAIAAARMGASALLCAPPPYCKPTQEGVIAHVRAIAHATDLPIILYDVPGRTGIAIADATIARLFESGLIVAVKDAGADLSRPVRLRRLCGPGLTQLSGDDATAAAYRAMGGHGCISVTANVTPSLCARLHRAWDREDLAEFGRLIDLLAPLHGALFEESNPIPVKAALELAGLCHADVRLPLTRATPSTRDALADLLPPLLEAELLGARRALDLVM